jgi:hypothetical protein
MVVVAAAGVATRCGARERDAGSSSRIFVSALLVGDWWWAYHTERSWLAISAHGDGFSALEESLWLITLLGRRRWQLFVLVRTPRAVIVVSVIAQN